MKKEKFKIDLDMPWPDAVLNPNHRRTWKAKLGAKKAARSYGKYYTLAQEQGQVLKDKDIILKQTLILHPPDKRRRDEDNVVRMFKPYRDGIFLALGADDHIIRETTIKWAEVIKGGRISVILEELRE